MPVQMALYGLICLIALAVAVPSRAAADDAYPVWWSDQLELDSLDQVEARLRRGLPYGGQADVWAAKGRVRIKVEARGDFTGDGIEDLLLSAGASLSRYRPDLTDLCLVTRASPGAPLRMIEVAPYSCRELGKYDRAGDGS